MWDKLETDLKQERSIKWSISMPFIAFDYEKNIIKNDTVQKKGKILCHKDTAENHVKILAQ